MQRTEKGIIANVERLGEDALGNTIIIKDSVKLRNAKASDIKNTLKYKVGDEVVFAKVKNTCEYSTTSYVEDDDFDQLAVEYNELDSKEERAERHEFARVKWAIKVLTDRGYAVEYPKA